MDELMTYQEFAATIKAKYPQYKDVDDYTLATKIVEKYPQYADRVSLEKKNQVETDTGSELVDGSSDSQEPKGFWEDTWSSLKANTKEALAGLAGTPQMLNKAVFSLLAPQELEDYINTLEPDQREGFIANMLSIGGPASSATAIGQLGLAGGDIQEELNKEAEKIREKMTQYDQSITEDIGSGEWGQAGRRLAVEGIGAVPSILQAMIPYVGLASVATGSAAQKQERLEAAGEGINLTTTTNAVLTGTVEALLEKYTAKQGKKLLNALRGAGKEATEKGVGEFIKGLIKEGGKGALGEGGTEALQSAGENLIDALTTGNDKEAMEIFTEITDSFLVGAVVGAPMKGGTKIAESINQKRLESGKEALKVPAEAPAKTPKTAEGIAQSLSPKVGVIQEGLGEKVYNYTTKEGVEVSLKDEGTLFTLNGKEVVGDIEIDFIGITDPAQRGSKKASAELDRIIKEADASDMSLSIVVDPAGATRGGGEVGLKPDQLKTWLESRGFLFSGDKAYRPKLSEDATQYEQQTYKAAEGEITMDEVKSSPSLTDLQDQATNGVLNMETGEYSPLLPGFYEAGTVIYNYDGDQLQRVENASITFDTKTGKPQVTYAAEPAPKGERQVIGTNPLSSVEVFETYGEITEHRREKTEEITRLEESGKLKPKQALALREESFENMKEALRIFEEKSRAKKGAPTQPEAQPIVTEEAKAYTKELAETKATDPTKYWTVSEVTPEDASSGIIVTTRSGKALVAKDGDIKGVFKKATSKAKGVAKALLAKAVKVGGVKLDNFDGYLTGIYEEAGFRVVSRTPFNEEYAPEGWNKKKHGKPDVVAMIYDPKGELAIEEKTFKSYDEMIEYRDSYLPETQGVVTPESSAQPAGQAPAPAAQPTTPTKGGIITKLRQIGNKSRKQAEGKGISKKEKRERRIEHLTDQTIDRQGSAKRKIRKAGLENTAAFMVANSGSSSHAKNLSEKAYNRTVKDLSNEEIRRLEEIIFARRVQAVDENRAARGLAPVKHPDGYTSADAQRDLDAYRRELGDAKFNDLMQRSENYFEEYKGLLKTMLDEGLISQETYDIFAEVNYQPRDFLDFMEDMHGNFLVEELNKSETIPLSQKQIKSLKEGSEGMINMDAFGILEASILTRSRAVFGNRMNKTFAEEFANRKKEIDALRKKANPTKEEQTAIDNFKRLEDNVRLDKIIGFKKSGEPKYAMEKANTKGWSPIYYYKDGVKHRVWMKDEMHSKYTDTNNQWLNATARENVALFSGTSAVKTLATGNNPLFFITNTPRDFLFVLAFSEEYDNNVAKNSIALFRDAAKGIKGVVTGSENYDKYLEYGGGMDFLALQGKYRNKGILKKVIDANIEQKTQHKISNNVVKRFLDKFNLASEVGIRMAVFNKSIANQLKALNVADINTLSKKQQDIIYTKAVKSARQLTDFNQGGKVTKALDSGIPYLNPAVQGTRAAVSSIKQRPLDAGVRMLQIAGYTVGMTMGAAMGAIAYYRSDEDEEIKNMTNAEIYFETLRGVSEYDLNNYFIIPLGTRDDNGNWNYLRVAKAQALSPALNAAEHMTRKVLAEQQGIEYKQDLGETLWRTTETNILPLEPNIKAVGRIPLVNAFVGGALGIDSYTGNPLSWDRGKIPEELEGIVDSRVEPMYRELGKLTGHSPVRLQKAMESYITTPATNPYIGIVYGVGNMFSGGEDYKTTADKFGELGKKAIRRVYKNTSEYNKVAKAQSRASDEIVDAYRKHIETEATVRNAVKQAKRTGDAQVAIEGLQKAYADHPDLLEKSVKWFKSEFEKKKLNPLVSSLRFEENKEVKALLIADRFGDKMLKDNPDYSEQEKAILKELLTEKVIDEEVLRLYVNIFKGKK